MQIKQLLVAPKGAAWGGKAGKVNGEKFFKSQILANF